MRSLLIALVLVALLPIGACGKKGDPKPPPSAETTNQSDEDAKKAKQ
jgi:predicted small lipoprotein YifL